MTRHAAFAGALWLGLVVAGCQESDLGASAEPAPPNPPAVTPPSVPAGQSTREERPAAQAEKRAEPPPQRAVRPGSVRDITFDDLKFEMEKTDTFKRSMLTPAIKSLDGQRIRIRGYILPSFQQSGITSFVLVRDNMECCFGPGAALYDAIVVEMQPGKSVEYTVRPVAVEGTFSLFEIAGPDGKTLAIYRMVADAVGDA